MSRGARISITIACLLCGAVACVPRFGSRPTFPEVRGIILASGLPVEGASVSISTREPTENCTRTGRSTTTGSDGTFVIAGEFGSVYLAPLIPVDAVMLLYLCVAQDANAPQVVERAVHATPVPDHLAITFDVVTAESQWTPEQRTR